jgi:hypothetical protein
MEAAFAAFVGALWALKYIMSTSWGTSIAGYPLSTPLWEYVMGEERGLGARDIWCAICRCHSLHPWIWLCVAPYGVAGTLRPHGGGVSEPSCPLG